MSGFVIKPLANGKLLSWNQNNRQWYRTVPVYRDKAFANKRLYFGTGRGRSDTESYRKALAKMNTHLEEINAIKLDLDALAETAPRAAALLKRIERGERGSTWIEGWLTQNRPGYLESTEAEDAVVAAEPDPDDVVDDPQELLAQEKLSKLALKGLVAKPLTVQQNDGSATMGKLRDKWLQTQYQRYEAGELSRSGYDSKKKGIKTFVLWCDEKSFGDARHVEGMLSDYRSHLMTLVANRTYERNTFNDKVKFLGQFVRWAYRNRELEEDLRNLPDIVKQLVTKKEGKPLTIEQVHAIWKVAEPRMKCFMALGLNCGFKNMDIAVLRVVDVQGGRLLRPRSKTSIEMNYELWPLTQQLIEETRQDSRSNPEETFFRGRDGAQLKSASVGTTFRKRAEKANAVVGKSKNGNPSYATFEQLRDTSADLVEKSIRDQGIDRALLNMFLAQKHPGASDHYTTNDPTGKQSTVLDAETRKLAEIYKLTI